jgi:hypothetical protein
MVLLQENTRDSLLTGALQCSEYRPDCIKLWDHSKVRKYLNFIFPLNGTPLRVEWFCSQQIWMWVSQHSNACWWTLYYSIRASTEFELEAKGPPWKPLEWFQSGSYSNHKHSTFNSKCSLSTGHICSREINVLKNNTTVVAQENPPDCFHACFSVEN